MKFLANADVAERLTPEAAIAAARAAFHAAGSGSAPPAGVVATHVAGGGFHVKVATLNLGRPLYVAKVNANFPANPERHGLPTIQGILYLADAERGTPLAIMESGELTALRTAAATAVAADQLAAPRASRLAIIGCGRQAAPHLTMLRAVRPIESVSLFDQSAERCHAFAGSIHDLSVNTAPSLREATQRADIVVTCTTSRIPFLGPADVRPGAFVAAVGADNEHKSEITPELMARARVVCDVRDQCAQIGDLHHAIAAGVMGAPDVFAELGEIVAGVRPYTYDPEAVVVFDSTGTALLDVATAAAVWGGSGERGAGSGN